MPIDAAWKQRIVSGHALDAVKVSNSGRILPPFTLPQPGRPCAPRALRTTLTDQLEHDPSAVDAEQVRAQFLADVRRGGGDDILPFTGQSAELIHDIPAASDLVARLVARPSPKSCRQSTAWPRTHASPRGRPFIGGCGAMNLTVTRGPR